MPVYCYQCSRCGPTELVRAMADAAAPATCECGRRMHRDYRAEPKSGHARREYLASSGGAFAHEMRDAYKRGKDWFRKGTDGKERQLNPPGFDLCKKTGDVVVPGRKAAKRQYLKTMGYEERG